MSKIYYRAFGIRYKQTYVGVDDEKYIDKIYLKFYHPKDLQFIEEGKLKPKISEDDKKIVIALSFKGGDPDSDKNVFTSGRHWNVYVFENLSAKKLDFGKLIHVDFNWEAYSTDKFLEPPQTTGKSILVAE